MSRPIETTIETGEGDRLDALAIVPDDAASALLLAHGAGAGMSHRFMTAIAESLAERRVATLRYQFPYVQAGRRRPDRPPRLIAAVRAGVDAAPDILGTLPLFAGGKSMGGRMTSTAQATSPLEGVRGLVFFGFPLHAAGREGVERADHLSDVDVPMLFLQGTRDRLADGGLIEEVTRGLGPRATLAVIDGADHGFHVLKRSGRTDDDVVAELADTAAAWTAAI